MGCENSDLSPGQDSDLAIVSRSDPNCDICPDAVCCCYVEWQNIFLNPPIDLHICGLVGTSYDPSEVENCSSMDINTGCYDLSTASGLHVLLNSTNPREYFCITPGTNFSLYNANGSGIGWVRVGCSGSGMPTGSIGLNLSYANGSYVRYFPTEDCDVQLPCPY